MKINFTKKQFKTLLDLIYLGHWTANAPREEALEEYDEMEQYIYKFAKEFGYEEYIEYASEYNSFFPTRKFEEEMDPIIQYYENEIFWENLSSNLARRDLQGIKNTINSHEDYMKKFFEIQSDYEEELLKNGLANLTFKK